MKFFLNESSTTHDFEKPGQTITEGIHEEQLSILQETAEYQELINESILAEAAITLNEESEEDDAKKGKMQNVKKFFNAIIEALIKAAKAVGSFVVNVIDKIISALTPRKQFLKKNAGRIKAGFDSNDVDKSINNTLGAAYDLRAEFGRLLSLIGQETKDMKIETSLNAARRKAAQTAEKKVNVSLGDVMNNADHAGKVVEGSKAASKEIAKAIKAAEKLARQGLKESDAGKIAKLRARVSMMRSRSGLARTANSELVKYANQHMNQCMKVARAAAAAGPRKTK